MDKKTDYTIILLATPILDVEERKIHLSELYSALAPYAGWQTNFTFTDSSSSTSMATFGLNVGANVGMQNGKNSGQTKFKSKGDSSGTSEANTESNTTGTSTSQATGENSSSSEGTSSSLTTGENSSVSKGENSSVTIGENSSSSTGLSTSHADTKGSSNSVGGSVGASVGIPGIGGVHSSVTASADYHHGWNKSATDTVGRTISETWDIPDLVRVEFFPGSELEFEGKNLFEMKYSDFKFTDTETQQDSSGITYKNLGFSVYSPSNEEIESIVVFAKGYYD